MTMKRALLFLLMLTVPLLAEDDLTEQIEAVSLAIIRKPSDAALYLERGELYRLHREWANAEHDYDRARALDPDLSAVDLGRGRMLLEFGHAREAIAPLQRFARVAPKDPLVHLLLGRALMAAGRPAEAAPAFEKALDPTRPNPDHVLEYVAALAAANRRDDALRYLDRRTPMIETYQLAAIDLEVRADHLDAALRRIEIAAAGTTRKEKWMKRRAELLAKIERRRGQS
jgi:tetratricopeptide (TPR) repeat protein